MNEIRETMSIKIEGKNEVDIETLSKTLTNTAKILKKSTQYSTDGEFQKFVIKDVRRGSFIVDIAAVVANNPNIIGEVATAISMFKDFLELKRHLGGKKPNDVIETQNNYNIENFNGNIINVNKSAFNAYTDSQDIDDSIVSMMKALDSDSDVTGLTVESSRDNESIEFNPKDLSKSYDVSNLNSRIEVQVVRQIVKVAKVDFNWRSKWQVYVNSDLVSVSNRDEEFKNEIDNHKFTTVTKLDVDLEIRLHVDSHGTPIQGKRPEYSILKVYRVINTIKDEQLSLIK